MTVSLIGGLQLGWISLPHLTYLLGPCPWPYSYSSQLIPAFALPPGPGLYTALDSWLYLHFDHSYATTLSRDAKEMKPSDMWWFRDVMWWFLSCWTCSAKFQISVFQNSPLPSPSCSKVQVSKTPDFHYEFEFYKSKSLDFMFQSSHSQYKSSPSFLVLEFHVPLRFSPSPFSIILHFEFRPNLLLEYVYSGSQKSVWKVFNGSIHVHCIVHSVLSWVSDQFPCFKFHIIFQTKFCALRFR